MGYDQRYGQLHIPQISQVAFDKLDADNKFWYYVQQIEELKREYARTYARLIDDNTWKYRDARSARVEKADKLAALRIEGMDQVQTNLLAAARIFGYNPKFDVRTEGEKLWYRPRNQSAERMCQRMEMIYMEKELQRG